MTIPPLATITGPLTYPGNMTAVASRRITATCVGPEGAVLRDSGGGMVGETTVFTDAGGDFSIDLTLNSDIDEASGVGPPGTYWRLTVGVRPAVSWLVRLETADADATVVIGDAAHTVVDPTPRGWVPLIGPGGDKGDTGNAATVAVGTVTTGAPGTSAAVTNSGTSSAASLNFTIPRGDQGDPLITRRVWSKNGTTGLSRIPITVNPGDPVLTTSVSNGRLRVASDTSTNGNHREIVTLPGITDFTDGRIDAIFYPPSVLDPAVATPQMGLALRATATGAVVLDMNIASYTYGYTFVANWGWPSGGSTAIPTIGTAPLFPAASRSPRIVGVQRAAGTPGTNIYYVDDAWDYTTGDTITVTGCADTTYNGDFTVTTIYPAGSASPYQAILASDAAHTTASARAADLGLVSRKTPATNALNPKQIYPFRASLEIVGKVARGKSWPVGKPEPDWMAVADFTSDTTPVAQTIGGVGVMVNHMRNSAYVEFGDLTVVRYA